MLALRACLGFGQSVRGVDQRGECDANFNLDSPIFPPHSDCPAP
jgi:hypothetical protein